jgi:lipoprotein-anchoring transpeptidase ErfK/SrfK
LRTGEQLKVIRGPFDALVELEKFRLTLFVQGRYAGRFKIGIGKDNATPEGEFEVLQKIPNPAYYGDVVIDQNDPNNPLGDYMVDLGDKLMIHGTNEPQSIGRAESRGCIRLDNRDVKDVYEILSVKTDRSTGSKVTIRR